MMQLSTRSTRRFGLVFCLLMIVSIVSACTEIGSSGSVMEVNPNGESSITLRPPSFINTRMVDFGLLQPTVMINNTEITMTQQNETWRGAASIQEGGSITLTVEWFGTADDGTRLLLARAFDESQQNVTSPVSFVVDDRSYETLGEPGSVFDPDADGISNLREFEQGLNPLERNVEVGGFLPEVQIFATRRTTEIDGRAGSDTFWSNGVYEDVNRETLFIDTMIRDDNNNIQEDPNPNYQWTAVHDGTHLSIFVYGKLRNGSTIRINGDSGLEYFNDDSLEIFLDGNLSRGTDYDGVDDMLINIPLTRGESPDYQENSSSADDKRIYRGGNVKDEVVFDVQDSNIVEFGTCFCGGSERITWEVRIDMAAAQIPVGKTFGFELQINRDDDGGDRDSKWAWARQALQPGQDGDLDDTWRFPVRMGRALLIPFPDP